MAIPSSTPTDSLPDMALALRAGRRALIADLVVLFKLRVVSLLVLSAVAGAFAGAGAWPGLSALARVVVAGGMAAAGASALNQYVERERDGRMARTRRRPLVTGRFPPRRALIAGLLLIAIPIVALWPSNAAFSLFLLIGAVIYLGVYTLWLKPRTFLNIVIGGAAGSAAVLSGGAAVGAWQTPAVLVLALVVFLWTPAHFWSLAIVYREDYRRADTPMLPTRIGRRAAAFWVAVHTLPTALGALLLALTPALGWLYFLVVSVATIDLVRRNALLLVQPTPARARSLFMSSNVYLMVVFVALCVDAALA